MMNKPAPSPAPETSMDEGADPELSAKLALLDKIMADADAGMAQDLASKYAPPPVDPDGVEDMVDPSEEPGDGLAMDPAAEVPVEGEADPAQLEQLLALLGG